VSTGSPESSPGSQPTSYPVVTVAELVDLFDIHEMDGVWVGDSPAWWGKIQFGGIVMGQALIAAARTGPPGSRPHSLHGYFLRPTLTGPPIAYEVTLLKDGRRFATRAVEAVQEGKKVFRMLCSLVKDGGDEPNAYGARLDPDLPGPDGFASEVLPGPWDSRVIGPAPLGPDGLRASTRRSWVRVTGRLPDDPELHDALVVYASDRTGTASRPLDFEGDDTAMMSLDHSVWFHRRARVDDWLFYDLNALVNSGGRGLVRGSIFGSDGQLAASVTQEVLLD
jgi:acyl-CoA thioesterase-2